MPRNESADNSGQANLRQQETNDEALTVTIPTVPTALQNDETYNIAADRHASPQARKPARLVSAYSGASDCVSSEMFDE